MKLPRNVSARDLITRFKLLGYEISRQTGSHIRLTTHRKGEHHITIPNHDPLRIGTLSAILNDVTIHLGKEKSQLVQELFGKKL